MINSFMKMITNTKSLPMHSLHYAKSIKAGIFPRAKSPVCLRGTRGSGDEYRIHGPLAFW